MNIKDKVNELLKFCSLYQGHTYMMDERRQNQSFLVSLPEEKIIREEIGNLQFILLTGEAGDGKSRLLRSLDDILKKHEFDIYPDFSAMAEAEKSQVLQMISDIIDGNSEKHIIIAANIGIFTKSVLQYEKELLEKLNKEKGKIRIFNFEKRNLAKDKKIFSEIVTGFLQYDGKICPECKECGQCTCRDNLEFLLTEQGIESLRVLCDTFYLIGEHITFRELLSLLAYMVTFGEDCESRKRNPDGCYSYESVFSKSDDRVLQNISRMDPALKKFSVSGYQTVEEYIKKKREFFFKTMDNKYELLNIDYLSEFQKIIHYFTETPFVDSSSVQDGDLYSLKRGLGRLTRKGESDLGMTVADTPVMLGNEIQTEFELGNIDIIWHRYGLDFNHLEDNTLKEECYNHFCMSYVYNGENGKLKSITMVIDYRLFKYLMLANDYFYLSHSSKSIEEYTINTFFRKILKTRKGVYGKMMVKFTDQKKEETCNFSLSLQERNRLLFPGEKIVKLKKEG